MKLGYTAFVIAFLSLTAATFAHELDLETLDLEELVNAYNENLQNVPNFVKSTFGNERVDIIVDGQTLVGLVGENGTIKEYKKDGVDKPTLRIYTTSETIEELLEEKKTLMEAIKDKSVDYQGVGFVKKIKFSLLKIVQGFFLRG